MKEIKLNNFQKFHITNLLNIIEGRHLATLETAEPNPLEFKITYRFKRIKDKIKVDISEYVGKTVEEVAPLMQAVEDTLSLPVFTEAELEKLLIFSEEIDMIQDFIVDETPVI